MNFYNQQLINDKKLRILRGFRLFWETLNEARTLIRL